MKTPLFSLQRWWDGCVQGKGGKKPQGRRIEITVKLEKGADQVMKGLDCEGRAEARDPWALPAAMPHSWRTRVLWAEWVR